MSKGRVGVGFVVEVEGPGVVFVEVEVDPRPKTRSGLKCPF